MKIPKWLIAYNFVLEHGQITALDVTRICNTVSCHKYLEILRDKGLIKEIDSTGKNYKVFGLAEKQMELSL